MPGDLGGNPIGHRCTGQKPIAHGECGDIVVWRGKGAVESALRDVECFQEGTALRNRRCLIHCDNLRRSVAASANCGEQQRYSLAVVRSKSKDRRHLALTDCIGNLLRGEVSSANAGRINIVMLQGCRPAPSIVWIMLWWLSRELDGAMIDHAAAVAGGMQRS